MTILNFSGTYDMQPFFDDVTCIRMDLRHLQGVSRMCDISGQEELRHTLEPYGPSGIHFIDSGNYHYISKLFIDKINFPFGLVVVDRHPDMQPPFWSEMLSCGGWVKEVMDHHPWLKQTLIIGAQDELIGQLPEEDRKRARFIATDQWEAVLEEVLVPPEIAPSGTVLSQSASQDVPRLLPIYLSIDKDVLTSEDAVTDWGNGNMTCSELTRIIQFIALRRSLIGVDICGDTADVRQHYPASRAVQVNDRTNRHLYTVLSAYLN